MYCCGPAPVKAIRSQRTDVPYDVPFVYAEVNADVHTIIMAQGKVINVSKDTERVGALICTKAVGVPRLQDITGSYKYVESMAPKQKMHSNFTEIPFVCVKVSPTLLFYYVSAVPAVPAVPAALTISSRSSTMLDVSTMSRGTFLVFSPNCRDLLFFETAQY